MKCRIKYNQNLFYIFLLGVCILYTIFYSKIVDIENQDIWQHTKYISMNLFNRGTRWEDIGDRIATLVYPVYHLLQNVLVLAVGMSYEMAATCILSFFGMLTILSVRWFFLNLCRTTNTMQKYVIDIVSIGSIFFGNISGILTEGRYYVRQGSPNPVHNPTIIIVKVVGLFCFICAYKLFECIKEDSEATLKYQILYALLLLFSCVCKPSYAFVVLPAWAVYTIILMFKEKNIKVGWKILIPTLPTIFILIVQYFFVFTNSISDVHKEMAIQFGSYTNFNLQQVIMVTIAMCFFPVIIAVITIKRKEEVSMQMQSMLILLFGWVEMFFLTDGGHGNFSWGWDLAVWYATIIAMGVLIKSRINTVFKFSVGIIFIYQLYVGVVYHLVFYYSGIYAL